MTLQPLSSPYVVRREVRTRVQDGIGHVRIEAVLARAQGDAAAAVVRVGTTLVEVQVAGKEAAVVVDLSLPDVALWWPRRVRRAGAARRRGGGRRASSTISVGSASAPSSWTTRPACSRLRVNGFPFFARGAVWSPPDAVALDGTGVVEQLERLASCGSTMVRLPGTGVYAGPEFWDACDRLGLLVWQDAMLATLDPSDDDDVQRELAAELAEVLRALQGRPSLAVVSGGSETEQQPTMLGLPAGQRVVRALVETFPDVVARVVPGTPYVTSSPSGGDLPTHSSRGVAHWFGVGGYRRPLHDTRRAAVRFAAECLALAAPPERASLRAWGWSDVDPAGSDRWRAGVPRDNGSSWDFEDVRDHYVRELFDLDPAEVRALDPERYLDLGRAAVAHLGVEVFTEWRRPGSGSSGGLVLQARDLERGAGWGLLDADGRAKSMLLALRRVWAPVALLATDEGLDGLWLHVANDAGSALDGRLEVTLLDLAGRPAETASAPVHVGPRSGSTVSVDGILGAFRDVLHAYRFGEQQYDAVHTRLLVDDLVVADHVHLVGGQARTLLPDVGLDAVAVPAADGWRLEVSARDLAQWVAIDLEAHEPVDSWFHLAPGSTRTVLLLGDHGVAPTGSARALNSAAPAAVRVAEAAS